MTGLTVIFCGPSTHGIDPGLASGCMARPPAGRGDVLAAVEAGATAIGLVDGSFETGASVWHKEILYALSRGVAVYGASSMGALRAAECDAFGMIGVGSIYEDYRSGRRVADADVALTYAPAELGYQPLTVPIVDVDYSVHVLEVRRKLAPATSERLRTAARVLHFKTRTWPAVFAAAGLDEHQQGILAPLLDQTPSRKTEDALMLLAMVSSVASPPPAAAPFAFNHTHFMAELEASMSSAGGPPR